VRLFGGSTWGRIQEHAAAFYRSLPNLGSLDLASAMLTNTRQTLTCSPFFVMGSGTPTVAELQRPEKLHDVLAKDKVEDCTPCRVTGMSNHTMNPALKSTDPTRCRCIYGSWGIQLCYGSLPTKSSRSQNTCFEKYVWNEVSTSRNHGVRLHENDIEHQVTIYLRVILISPQNRCDSRINGFLSTCQLR
jgi:hypothetical protein